MKQYLQIFLSIFVIHSTFAQCYDHIAGDTISIFSIKGLHLRELPDKNSKILLRIDYGSEIIVQSQTKSENVENRNGCWIKTSYNGHTGYVFSGFTTNLRLPNFQADTNGDCFYSEILHRWCVSKYDSIKPEEQNIFESKIFNGHSYNIIDYRHFNDGTSITYITEYEGTGFIFETYQIGINDVLNFLNCSKYLKENDIDCDRNNDITIEYNLIKGKFGNIISIDSNIGTIHFANGKTIITMELM